MPEATETTADDPLEVAEAKAKRSRARLKASQSKVVPHISKLKVPITLFRMVGNGSAKRDRQWVASLDELPTIEGIQSQFGGGRYVAVDPGGQRYEVALAEPIASEVPVTDPPVLDRALYPTGHSAEPLYRQPVAYNPHTGRPLASAQPVASYDPHTGRPLASAQPVASYDPHTGRPLASAHPRQALPSYDPYTGQPNFAQGFRPPHPAAAAAPADSGMLGLIWAELQRRNQAPMPPAADFAGQGADMFRALDMLETFRERFAPEDVPEPDDEDDESTVMGLLKQVLPMLLPGGGPAAAPAMAAPNPAVVAPRIAAPRLDAAEPARAGMAAWAAEPLTAAELANVQTTMGLVGRWAPTITLDFLVAAGAEAGITKRQAVFLFQRICVELLPNQSAGDYDDDESSEEEEWSDDDQQDSDEADESSPRPPVPVESAPSPDPVPLTSPAPPSSGPL